MLYKKIIASVVLFFSHFDPFHPIRKICNFAGQNGRDRFSSRLSVSPKQTVEKEQKRNNRTYKIAFAAILDSHFPHFLC